MWCGRRRTSEPRCALTSWVRLVQATRQMRSGAASHPKSVRGLEIHPLEDGCIVYTPRGESVHHLNATATLVLALCTGQNSRPQIVDLVREAYRLKRTPSDQVARILARMEQEGLIGPTARPASRVKARPARIGRP